MNNILGKIVKLLIGFPLYVLANNIIANLGSLILFQYCYFYIYGVSCTGGFNTKSAVITFIVVVFKLLIIALYNYTKKGSFLFYYLIFDVIISVVLLLDYLFGTLWIAYFYSNRHMINLSKYLFGNYALVIIQSVIVLLVLLNKKGILKRKHITD
ncbi:hypothetical protein [Flavobacterium litorale]|uniref:Uncharacterized protein n=1 Tax=Flavobacterium litorale TaxID=2856519 RepID=A0ABX8V7E1_9FLAO|nr:hypothetical protein [Flavobacterium litorale]QYJ68764.1 hypothetical protein K1I41_02470 [Flavobacterium litorale]